MAKNATIRDVARLAEVSLGSISNYLTNKKPVSEAARKRIKSAIAELEFIPNTAVRVMRGGRSPVIGFLIPDAGNPFFTEVARGLEDSALSSGFMVVSCNTNGDRSRQDHYVDALSQLRVVGAVVTALTADEEHLRRLEASGAAVVLLAARAESSSFPYVDVDNELGGYLAMRHLLELGHRDIVLVAGPAAESQVRDRFRGAHCALAEFGVNFDRVRRIDARGHTIDLRVKAGFDVLDLTPRPTAAFCANDLLALGLETAALGRGLMIPADIAIVGFDDIESARLATVALSTVRQPQYEIGRTAGELVIAKSLGKDVAGQSVMFEPTLVVRESTRSTSIDAVGTHDS